MITIWYAFTRSSKRYKIESDNLEAMRIVWDTLNAAGYFMISNRP